MQRRVAPPPRSLWTSRRKKEQETGGPTVVFQYWHAPQERHNVKLSLTLIMTRQGA